MAYEISKAFLHTGRDLNLGNGLVIRHPTVEDIVSINNGFFCDAIYWSYVVSILSDPYDNMVFLDDLGIDYETQAPFDVFKLRWKEPQNTMLMKEALSFFIEGKHDFELGKTLDGEAVLYDTLDTSYAFGPDVFGWIVSFVTKINCIERSDKINPANKSAKRVLIEDMRDEMARSLRKKSRDPEDFNIIGDGISAVVYGGTGGITPFNFMQLGIYQLMCGASTTHKKLKVGAMLNGIYTGMLSADKLPQDELCWA